jgi:hypothetical protein
MTRVIKIKSNAKTEETDLNISIKIDSNEFVFPNVCCNCLSKDNLINKEITGFKLNQTKGKVAAQVGLLVIGGLRSIKSIKPEVLLYTGKVPYCKNCESKANTQPGVAITSFDIDNIEFTFINDTYARMFSDENNSVKQIDKNEGRVITKTCKRCGGINPPNAYYCKSCGSSL